MNPLIAMKNVTVSFNRKLVLDNVSMTVDRGHMTTIVGPNGSGKTTLIQVLLRQVSYTGTVACFAPITFGYVPQSLQVNPTLPLRVIDFINSFQGTRRHTPKQVMTCMGLYRLRHVSFHKLSGGERQRAMLARALMGDPNLLILDEIMAGLDIHGETQLAQFLLFWVQELKRTVLLVSHDLHYVLDVSDHVVCLNRHVCCSGSPQEIKKNPKTIVSLYVHHHDHVHTERLESMAYKKLFPFHGEGM